MKLRGCAAHPQREGRELLAGYYNYLIGNDPTRHATYVRRYQEAWVKGVYAGIDMRYYLEGGRLRYDWVVQPGGDPSQIVFGLEGSEKTYIDSEGRLVFMTRFGEVKLAELRVYQGDREIGGRFVERPGGWGIEVGSYDPMQPLVIDPLVYSTYIGGSGTDEGRAIAVDGSGNAYVTGYTNSTDYDVTPGAFQTTKGGGVDVFVTKVCHPTIITLTSAPSTDNQTVCVNTPTTPITYSTTGATGATFSDLPAGVTGTFSGGNITISGTPTASGTFNYTVTLTGGCGNVTATGTIIVQPNNTITLTSAPGTNNQTVCVDTAITPITYSTTGATDATFSGLPAGVTGTFSDGYITISGTPTVAGNFSYTVILTGGCGNVTATGTLVVNACPSNSLLGGGGGGPTWRVYPNPTSGSFTIESGEDGTFELINGHGQVVQVYEVRRGRTELQATLSAGVYYLRERRSGTVQKVVLE
jgi:hypothetical protein